MKVDIEMRERGVIEVEILCSFIMKNRCLYSLGFQISVTEKKDVNYIYLNGQEVYSKTNSNIFYIYSLTKICLQIQSTNSINSHFQFFRKTYERQHLLTSPTSSKFRTRDYNVLSGLIRP